MMRQREVPNPAPPGTARCGCMRQPRFLLHATVADVTLSHASYILVGSLSLSVSVSLSTPDCAIAQRARAWERDSGLHSRTGVKTDITGNQSAYLYAQHIRRCGWFLVKGMAKSHSVPALLTHAQQDDLHHCGCAFDVSCLLQLGKCSSGLNDDSLAAVPRVPLRRCGAGAAAVARRALEALKCHSCCCESNMTTSPSLQQWAISS
eukprot:797299-Amphidinium_carterae.2